MASCMSQISSGLAPRTAPKASASYTGLARVSLPTAKAARKHQFVSNGIKTRQMLVWQPVNNKYFETLSYLPPLSQEEIGKQVDYMTRNSWTPCLEFADPEHAYVSSTHCVRLGSVSSNYLDNRYWTMFKLPMFGCTDSQQVLNEIEECTKDFPNAYIRLVAFDAVRQMQIAGLLVHRPPNCPEYRPIEERSV